MSATPMEREQLTRLIKDNDNDQAIWKSDTRHTPYIRMKTLNDLKHERETMLEVWKNMTGVDYVDIAPSVASSVAGRDEGGGSGKEPVRV